MGTATSGERAARVSVLVPAYDVEDYAPEALGSVPVRAGVEVIVVDDGSSDGTADVAEAALEGHPDARVIRAPHRGAGAARNLALAEATGEWVLFLDADDRLADGALEALLGAATSGPDIDVVVADLRRFPAGVGKERFTWQRIFEHAPMTIDDAADLEHLVYAAGPANKLFRRAAVERVGARFGDTGAFEDGFFTIPMLLAARRIAVIPDVVYEYRVRERGDGLMDGLFDRPDNYLDHLRFAAFLARLAREEPEEDRRRWLHRSVARQNLPFVDSAAGHLGPDELEEFRALVHEAFRDIDLEIVERFSRRPSRRRAALAALDLLPLPDPMRPVEVSPSDDGWGIEASEAPPELRHVPRLRWRVAEAATSGRDGDLALELHHPTGDAVTVLAEHVELLVADRRWPLTERPDGTWRATVDATALPDGRHELAVLAEGHRGTVRTTVDARGLGTRRTGTTYIAYGDGHVDVAGLRRPVTVARHVTATLRRRLERP